MEVSASKTSNGTRGGGKGGGSRGDSGGKSIGAPPTTSYKHTEQYQDCMRRLGLESACIPRGEYSVGFIGAPDGVEIPPITIADLASFSPARSALSGEPDNLGVAGLPVNFTTDAAAHTRSGTLFGFPLTARFTPARFTFHYGDGESRATTTPGSAWAALGVAQFTPTDTSHTYRERGTYTASVDTIYTAEVDLGAGWFPVTGTLTIPGPGQDIRIFEAKTALVAYTCTENPRAAGC